MTLNITYRELDKYTELDECVSLQKEVLGLPHQNTIPSLLLNVYTRKTPKTGIILGAFSKEKGKNKLIGFIMSIAGIENHSLYGVIIIIKKDFRSQNVGIELFLRTREIAIKNNITDFYGIFDPLEGNLAKLYFNKLGMTGIEYEQEVHRLTNTDLPNDKVVLHWKLNSKNTIQKINRHLKKKSADEIIKTHPIVTSNNRPDSNVVLLKIPDDFLKLKHYDQLKAIKWRKETRELFNTYLNNNNYIIKDFYTRINDNTRESYYLLEKLISY
jgi:predicted GNAT superfamily acetyltransferase